MAREGFEVIGYKEFLELSQDREVLLKTSKLNSVSKATQEKKGFYSDRLPNESAKCIFVELKADQLVVDSWSNKFYQPM